MKLGVLTVLFYHLPFEEALDRIKAEGLDALELGTGNYPGTTHCDPKELLANRGALDKFGRAIESRGLVISALSCHGNPLHPQRELARESHEAFLRTAELAEQLGVTRINLFSGCPGDPDGSRYPNWVTCAWPTEYGELLRWQWEQVISYWRSAAAEAASHGVDKLCFEMHPGFVVYNPETLLRLRDAVGPAVGANFDPSHLFWQGIDPVEAIKVLGRARALYHVHAKDTALDPWQVRVHGVLDTKPLSDAAHRAWLFRTVGYGHDLATWRAIVSALRLVGYDDVISIEHEDILVSVDEGFRKAVSFLRECLLTEAPAQAWWT